MPGQGGLLFLLTEKLKLSNLGKSHSEGPDLGPNNLHYTFFLSRGKTQFLSMNIYSLNFTTLCPTPTIFFLFLPQGLGFAMPSEPSSLGLSLPAGSQLFPCLLIYFTVKSIINWKYTKCQALCSAFYIQYLNKPRTTLREEKH